MNTRQEKRPVVRKSEWHVSFNWKDLRVGVAFGFGMLELNLPFVCVWRESYWVFLKTAEDEAGYAALDGWL